MVGGYSDSGGSDDFSLVRYNAAGTLDTSFGGGDGVAFAGIVGRAETMVLQADGKVVLSGYTTIGGYQVCLVRFNADGTLAGGLYGVRIGAAFFGEFVFIQKTGIAIVQAGQHGFNGHVGVFLVFNFSGQIVLGIFVIGAFGINGGLNFLDQIRPRWALRSRPRNPRIPKRRWTRRAG
ncbi:MAG: hypothetical protein HC794_01610, partial [Nitrospiraceae bacterium]|nr:hypothetical protein [Nitrospiraceae bacterium]